MWKDIKEYEGYYQVNEEGKVKSVERWISNGSPNGMIKKEQILKTQQNKNGYLQVTLCKQGKKKCVYVHRLVAEAFLDNPNNLETVNHKNGNKLDNNVSNLEFSSYQENNQHAYDTGLHNKNENHYKARLTIEQVKEIKENGKYDTYEAIGKKYGVSKATIRDILVGNTWKNI